MRRAIIAFCLLAATAAGGTSPEPVRVELTDALGAYTPGRGYGYDFGTAPNQEGRAFYLSFAVPEGNCRITVTFGDAHTASATTVKAESRRLLAENIATKPGEFVTRTFLVNTRTTALPPLPFNAPGGTAVVLNERETGSLTWDNKLTLEFDSPAGATAHGAPIAHVRSVTCEPADGPTVFIAGDSTVCDQRWEDGAGWGQMLPRFLPGITVANHAESGETLKSYVSSLRLAKLLSQLKAGDWVFIQFGHNDEKRQWPQTYAEAHTTYAAYLRAFVAEMRLRGATPVLVTSMQRQIFDAHGRVRNTHGDYPAVVREIADAEKVALIDLERMSVALYEALGPSRTPLAFANGGKDPTHHNNYGAYELAKCVVQGIRDARLPLAANIAADFTGFDPAHPDDPATFALPPSPADARSVLPH